MRWLCHKHQPRRSFFLRSTFLSLLLLTYSFSFGSVCRPGFPFYVQDCVGNSKLNSRRERTPVVPWGTLDLRPIEDKATWGIYIALSYHNWCPIALIVMAGSTTTSSIEYKRANDGIWGNWSLLIDRWEHLILCLHNVVQVRFFWIRW